MSEGYPEAIEGVRMDDFPGLVTAADEFDLKPGVSPAMSNVSVSRLGALRIRCGLSKVNVDEVADGKIKSMYLATMGLKTHLVWNTAAGSLQADPDVSPIHDESD